MTEKLRRGGKDNRILSLYGQRVHDLAMKYGITCKAVRVWNLTNPMMTNEARKVLVNEIRRYGSSANVRKLPRMEMPVRVRNSLADAVIANDRRRSNCWERGKGVA